MFHFLQMGDYGFYVWGSVGSVVALFSWMAWRADVQFKQIQQRIKWGKDVQP